MAAIVYGRKLREDAEQVAYSFGRAPDTSEGILVIPVENIDAWYVEGHEGESVSARRILQKAVRLQRRTGSWPEDASFYA